MARSGTALVPAAQQTAVVSYQRQLDEIEEIVQTSGLTTGAQTVTEAFALARGLQRLRELITPEMMKDVMALQNTSLGFRTDQQGGYDQSIVKDCVIEALLRGVPLAGNCFNIISKRAYITKEGVTWQLRKVEGLTDLRISLGVPRNAAGGALVDCEATWKMNGAADTLKATIPIRVNQGMGADAILGKAERKLRYRVYLQITGSEHSLPNVDDIDEAPMKSAAPPAGPTLDGLAAQRAATNGATAAPAPPPGDGMLFPPEPGSSDAANA